MFYEDDSQALLHSGGLIKARSSRARVVHFLGGADFRAFLKGSSGSRAKNIRSCKETLVSPSIHEPSLVRREQPCFRANSGKVSDFILCTRGRSHMKFIKGKVHQFCCDTCFTSSIARRRSRFQNSSSVVSCRLRVMCVPVFNYFRKPIIFPL